MEDWATFIYPLQEIVGEATDGIAKVVISVDLQDLYNTQQLNSWVISSKGRWDYDKFQQVLLINS